MRDNVAGRLPGFIGEAGSSEVREAETFNTVLGPVCLYRASRPTWPALPSTPDERVRSEMAGRLGAGLAFLLLSACQLPGSSPACTTQIDWVDFIQVGSTQYVAAPGTPATLQEGDLGPVIAHVKVKLSGDVCDPNYRPKDGDAGLLEPGTAIYQVNGHPSSQLLAARRGGNIVAYEAKEPTRQP